MKRLAAFVSILGFLLASGETRAEPVSAAKREAVASIDRQAADMTGLSDQIWAFAELALRETRSAAMLADYAEAQGFEVERGVAEMPTAFVASYGKGRPVIGVMGEYDALPGISQKAQTTQEAYEQGAGGHGCGHNLFGPASLAAAIAIKERIAAGELKGTIRFYGAPAEEDIGGKVYMIRAGLFDDVDIALAWHPGDEITADTEGSQAMVDFAVEFSGKTAHAAADPWNGRSALDGVELFTHAINLMREHVEPTVRIHYVIVDGGDVPNVVPDHAVVWTWMRDSKHTSVDKLVERARAAAQGAALATGTESTFAIQAGSYEMLVNREGAKLIHENLSWLGPIEFTEQEQEFARAIQRETGVEPVGLKTEPEPLDLTERPPDGGSTDVADVSWVVPTLHLTVTTAAHDAPWHAWPVVATGGMSIGHKGMIYAAKALTATMVDLYEDPDQRKIIAKEFEEQTKGFKMKFYIPEGPPPVPTD
ncbi:MAG: amidohydrolase [Deltaproteobacteria bacterium]|jgi:aminobenzoyl-glutamate utilization protein B|nr:amidohydrolase [Deltaproteobacteria bacterium]